VSDSSNVLINQIGYQKSYTGKPEKRFFRYLLSYDKAVIKEWAEWTIVKVLDLYNRIKSSEKLNHDIDKTTAEWEPDFSQCKYCPFSIACENDPGSRLWILKTKFEKSERRYDLFAQKEE
jgi:hypothetical protein